MGNISKVFSDGDILYASDLNALIGVINDNRATALESMDEISETTDALRVNLVDSTRWIYPKNWLNENALTSGYVDLYGNSINNDNFKHTDKIPVKPGAFVVLSYGFEADNNNRYSKSAIYISAYDADGNVKRNSGIQNAYYYEVPNDVYFVIVSFDSRNAAYSNRLMVEVKNNSDVVKAPYYYETYFTPFIVPKGHVYDIDMFGGNSDSERLSNALNRIDAGVIACGNLCIDSPIYLYPNKDYRKIEIVNASVKINGSMFVKSFSNEYFYCPKFVNCTFGRADSSNTSGVIYELSSDVTSKSGFVSPAFINCYFENVRIMNSSVAYAQALHILNCEIHNDIDFCHAYKYWDLKMINCLYEPGTGCIFKSEKTSQNGDTAVYDCYHTIIENNIIEGRQDSMFDFGRTTDLHIDKNYFEGNSAPYFSIDSEVIRFTCKENYFNEWDESYTHLITITREPQSSDTAGNVLVQPNRTNITIFG